MLRLTLDGTDIAVSRLSFGTAQLHHLPSSRRRQRLLAAAFDHGFTHFDTAPIYGSGLAESELGRFVSKRRPTITIATKVGLYPPGSAHLGTASVWIRKAAGRLWPALSRPMIDWSLAAAAESVDRSMRRLRVDTIDLLMLHEPVFGALPADEFVEWFSREQRRGRVRAWGLAGAVHAMEGWLAANHPIARVLQVPDSLDGGPADVARRYGRQPQMTYGYFSSASTSLTPPEIVRRAMRRNPTGSVLVSTRRIGRIRELAEAAEQERVGDH